MTIQQPDFMKRLLLFLLFSLTVHSLFAQEICDNGIDDDGDGLIDLNDPDCECMDATAGIIPNPSFEEHTCCPQHNTQLYCAQSWRQASLGTSDYFNTCDYIGDAELGYPSFPLPDSGTAYVGFFNNSGYKEYIGTCLDSNMIMEAGKDYVLSLYLARSRGNTELNFSIFGTPDCSDFPWFNYECPVGTGAWFLLSDTTITLSTDSSWHQITIEFNSSVDLKAIAIGGSCNNVQGNWNYYFADALILLNKDLVGAKINESGNWCNGNLLLTASVLGSGGTWQWYRNGIALLGETSDRLNLMPYEAFGNYSAVYTKDGSCVIIDHIVDTSLLVNVPLELAIRNSDTAVCSGSSVPINAVGTPGYQYIWQPTIGVSDPTILNPEITPVDTLTYYTLTASHPDCPDSTVGIRIGMQYAPDVQLGEDKEVCHAEFVPLESVVSPYRSDYTYKWKPAAGLQFNGVAQNYFIADSNITYVLEVSTPIGCTGMDSIHVKVHPDSFAAAIPDTGYCPPQAVPLWATGGTDYRWEPAYGLNDVTIADPVANPQTPTTYTVMVTNDYGCIDSQQVFVDVYPNAVLSMPDTIRIYPGEQYHLEPGTNCHYFNWFPTNGINSTTVGDPIFSPEVRTRYFVTATTEQGCVVRDSIDVLVEETVIDMPNAFAPGKGAIPVFKPALRGLAELTGFSVYNRWGNKVFHTTNIKEGWDGTYNGQPQPVGVYIYQIEAVTNTGKHFRKTGNVTLIR